MALSPRPAMHRIWDTIYFSQFKRSKEGRTFREIKSSKEDAATFAKAACDFLNTLINSFEGWAIVTTPRRRHDDGFHFATEVCRVMSATLGIPFYDGAVATMNRDRLHPDFILLREIAEPRVIVYDDIITTGATLIATSSLFQEKEIVLNIIGISSPFNEQRNSPDCQRTFPETESHGQSSKNDFASGIFATSLIASQMAVTSSMVRCLSFTFFF